MKRPYMIFAGIAAGFLLAGAAHAADLKIALIAGKTGPLEAYAKQTEDRLHDGPRISHQGHDDLEGPQDQRASSRTTS